MQAFLCVEWCDQSSPTRRKAFMEVHYKHLAKDLAEVHNRHDAGLDDGPQNAARPHWRQLLCVTCMHMCIAISLLTH